MSEHETHAKIIAKMRERCIDEKHSPTLWPYLDRLEAAHEREIEEAERRGRQAAMKAVNEVVDKIGPLYDAESVGNAAKLRDAAKSVREVLGKTCAIEDDVNATIDECEFILDQALAEPPRNCDKVKDHSDAIEKFEKWMGFSPKTADEQDEFFKEHWFEFAMWIIDMNESEVSDGSK